MLTWDSSDYATDSVHSEETLQLSLYHKALYLTWDSSDYATDSVHSEETL